MSMMITKWGNSLGLRIPKAVAQAAGIKEGTPVKISARNGKITVEPVYEYDLETLVAGITAENRHEETDWGPPVGREEW